MSNLYYKAFLVIPVLIHSWTTLFIPVTCASILSNITDLHSLLAFKAAIEFDPNNVLARNWTSDTNFCHWYGVTCSKRRQRITHLDLPNLGLKGPISPQIGNLTFLTILYLANNSFHGRVIQELGHLSRLKYLNLGFNNLKGEIPITLSLCRKLQLIGIVENGISGTLPKNLTTLPSLRSLYLRENNLTGTIPQSFGNMSTLQLLSLENNQFHGTIPSELAFLPRLTLLSLGQNYLSGTIHTSLFNISSLETLALPYNSLTGDLPKDTDSLQLPNLNRLFLGVNQLTGTLPSHFYNASKLTLFSIEENTFTGALPAALPLSLQIFSAHTNRLQDEIPKEIGTLKNLTYLDLGSNNLRGTIPKTINGMESMQQLWLDETELEGPIPEEICSLSKLGLLDLYSNRFSGSIPGCIGNLSGLQQLSLATNELSSTLPRNLWSLDQLISLDLSLNLLHGNLGRNFMTMKSLDTLNLSHNQLSGNFPDFSRSFQSLTVLDLSWNSFSGLIPESFGKLITLVDLNISNNNLSGTIPVSLEALTILKHLNLSYNNLSGVIPMGGPFLNFTPQSFLENQQLCGKPISKSCSSHGLSKRRNKQYHLSYIVPIIVVVLIVSALIYVVRKRRNIVHQNQEISLQEQRMISYHELVRATNGFSEANFLGSGGFGRVYKGILLDGEDVAVKLLNLTVDGAIKSFDAECRVLRIVRHRNLVKVITTCSNPELRALVLEYIPNGSLEKWLFSHNYFLSFLQRVSIMLDVAVAMEYLHCGQAEPVIHCDLKPSNVLLDNDMVAHVGDFGIAKVLAANKSETQTSTLGTLGYISPEYGTEGRVSTKGDVYSFGIMVLETFTRKKPTDEMFTEGSSLRQWVNSLFPDQVAEVVDENLLNANAQRISEISLQHNLLAVLELGLDCSRESPEERLEMKDVITKLNKTMSQILSG